MADGPPDQVLFRDRGRGRAAGERRSRDRARALAPFLGIDIEALAASHPLTVIVTGSKGKGTAAAYASAVLIAAGLRTGTLTSPALGGNHERIRVDGAPITEDAYAELITRMAMALRAGEGSLPSDGYLAPTGLFSLAAVRHFLDAGCDAWVLEAGMGGASDEVSLFAADALVLTPVFDEHLGVLADSVAGIARDKIGAASASTLALWTAPQRRSVVRQELAAARLPVETVRTAPLRGVRWPQGLGRRNAWAGAAAALALLRHAGIDIDSTAVARLLNSVRLPGRLSTHMVNGRRWVVDAAANPAAVAAAIRWCAARGISPKTVLLCIPDGKDIAGVRGVLREHHVIPVRVNVPHLTFSGWNTSLPALGDIDLATLGDTVLALGTVSFVGEVLAVLGVPTGGLFSPGSSRSASATRVRDAGRPALPGPGGSGAPAPRAAPASGR